MRMSLAAVAIGGCFLVGCGRVEPFTGQANDVSAAVQRTAIPLQDAIRQGLVAVETRDHSSTRTALGMVLNPKSTSQPWIRIDHGWQAVDPEKKDQAYITARTVYVRMPKRRKYPVSIPHVQRTRFRSLGIPDSAELSRIDDQRLLDFFDHINASPEWPGWKTIQVSTWLLSQNLGYEHFRPAPKGGKPRLASFDPKLDSREILAIFELLAELGHEKEDFALWTGVMDAIDRGIAKYDGLVDAEDAAAILPFKDVCAFYPFEAASDVLVSAFDRHTGRKGLPFRRHAFAVLQKIGGPEEKAHVRRLVGSESDPELTEAMAKFARIAAAPK